jgi:hypothetical protein
VYRILDRLSKILSQGISDERIDNPGEDHTLNPTESTEGLHLVFILEKILDGDALRALQLHGK